MKKNAREMHFDSVGESEVGVNLEAEKKRWNQ